MNLVRVVYLVFTAACVFFVNLNLLNNIPSLNSQPAVSMLGMALLESVFVLGTLIIFSLYFELWQIVKRSNLFRLIGKHLLIPVYCVCMIIPKSCWISCSFEQFILFFILLFGVLVADLGNQFGNFSLHFFQRYGYKDMALLFDKFPPAMSHDLIKMDILVWIFVVAIAIRKFM